MTSQDTFENAFRQRLLDLIYGQWGILGTPFSDRGPQDGHEVIDPEALLWCSLEFLPTEPRLSEAVLEWLRINEDYIVRQRVYKIRSRNDPRAIIWQSIDRRIKTPRIDLGLPTEPCHGLTSPAEVADFARLIEERKARGGHEPSRLGRIGTGSATLLLKARDLLGHDIRHFLLVYLLANPQGSKLKDIRAWSGHAYRSLADAAGKWETGNIVTLDSGYCRLTASEPFRALLQLKTAKIVLVKWLTVFETSVRLLRDLAKARQKGFGEESTILRTLRREAEEQLKSALPNSEQVLDSSIGHLLRVFAVAD